MAQQTINIGSGVESGDGDTFRVAWGKAVSNFADLDVRVTANLGAISAETTRALTAEAAETARALAAEALKAPLASPAFTGTPTAPTQAASDNSTKVATTNYVDRAVAAGGSGGGGTAYAVQYVSQTLTSAQQLQARQNIAAVASGDVISLGNGTTATTQAAGDNTTKVATDAFVTGALSSYASTVSATYLTQSAAASTYAPLASPALTGTPTAPTAAAADNSTKLATTAYADRAAANVRLLSFRNRLINGNFAINQRNAPSASTAYAAGAYVMDRWKAGAGGVTLSFATATNGDVSVTITAGTLVQVIEGSLYLPEGGTYALSWSGTATARIYQGAASGSYAVSPISGTGLTGGTNTTVEFGTGTISLAQLEPGSSATVFERRDDELRRCQRYFWTFTPDSARDYFSPVAGGLTILSLSIQFPVTMRAVPTIAFTGSSGGFASGYPALDTVSTARARLRGDTTDTTTSSRLSTFSASAEL